LTSHKPIPLKKFQSPSNKDILVAIPGSFLIVKYIEDTYDVTDKEE
jgi:hypothetical protein